MNHYDDDERERADFHELCYALTTNKPGWTYVFLGSHRWTGLMGNARWFHASQALRGNTNVKKLYLQSLDTVSRPQALKGVADFIANSSSSLDDVTLYGHNLLEITTRSILEAVGSHGNMKKLSIYCSYDPQTLANALVSNRTTLERLTLAAPFEEDTGIMATSFSSLCALKELELEAMGFDDDFISLLNRLSGPGLPGGLDKLALRIHGDKSFTPLTDVFAGAIREFLYRLETTTSLVDLEIAAMSTDTTLLNGVHGHPSIRNLEMWNLPASSAIQLLRRNPSLQKISEVYCESISEFCGVLNILQTNTTLLYLIVHLPDCDDDDWTGEEAAWTGHNDELSHSLSQVRNLQRLVVSGDSDIVRLILPGLLRGFELNTSLTDINISWSLHVDYKILKKIKYYTERNRFLPRFSGHDPETNVPLTSSNAVIGSFPGMLETITVPEHGLSVVLETLRMRNELFKAWEGWSPP